MSIIADGWRAAPAEPGLARGAGGPCRDRTYDQEIKSLLLYQLS
jgi:hypothetical protein